MDRDSVLSTPSVGCYRCYFGICTFPQLEPRAIRYMQLAQVLSVIAWTLSMGLSVIWVIICGSVSTALVLGAACCQFPSRQPLLMLAAVLAMYASFMNILLAGSVQTMTQPCQQSSSSQSLEDPYHDDYQVLQQQEKSADDQDATTIFTNRLAEQALCGQTGLLRTLLCLSGLVWLAVAILLMRIPLVPTSTLPAEISPPENNTRKTTRSMRKSHNSQEDPTEHVDDEEEFVDVEMEIDSPPPAMAKP